MKVYNDAINVLVWSEATVPEVVYPNGINATITTRLNESEEIVSRTVDIDEPNQGVGEDRLAWADVFCW